MADIPGWYADAMEQNIGMLVSQQRAASMPLGELVDLFMDPSTPDGEKMSPEHHTETLALCFALCVKRLAKVDIR